MIQTERLILRGWEQRDRAPFAAMGRDPRVMATLGPLIDRAQTDAVVDRLAGMEARLGYTFWALERRADGTFLGFCGLKPGPDDTPIQGGVEIGWRLAHAYWGHGYVHEAARACIAWLWSNTDEAQLWAITTPGNVRSLRVMERLGMQRVAGGEFDHPALAEGDPLRRHLTYRIARPRQG